MKRVSSIQSVSSNRTKKVACTVSAAALMLGVSSAATIGLHFQENYCGAPAYSGYLVTLTAFGVPPSSWENLLPMQTGYGSCPLITSFTEVISTNTTTDGLNPLPQGQITVNWTGSSANYDPFGGYAGTPPYYYHPGGGTAAAAIATNPGSGEEQIYATFIRDGLNFGPGSSGGDNDQPPYVIDITGLKSVFTNSPFVVELMASGDSIEFLTNAYVIEVLTNTANITNTVIYPNLPPVQNSEGQIWYQGTGGGLSDASAPVNADHIQITSAQPAHFPAPGPNNAGTISGFIITDKPVVTMSPQPVPLVGPGDVVDLSAYAIGVPPMAFQWRMNGSPISGATGLSYIFTNTDLKGTVTYDLVVSNAYGYATSAVSTVTGDYIALSRTNNVVVDTSGTAIQHDGDNMGATWLPSFTDTKSVTRSGVMSFNANYTNGITVADDTNFDGSTGTITLWMLSTGTDTTNGVGNYSAALVCQPTGTAGNDFLLSQDDSGLVEFAGPQPSGLDIQSTTYVSDGTWHFIALTFDETGNGGAGLYVDGVLQATNNNGGNVWNFSAGMPLEFGYTSDDSFRNYNGLLDDIRFYSTVLTGSQIANIYSTGSIVDAADLQLQLNFTAAPGNGTVLTWKEGSAVLQSAPSLNGPWTDLPGAASPYTIVPSQAQQFFRYRYVPQHLVSNPYLM